MKTYSIYFLLILHTPETYLHKFYIPFSNFFSSYHSFMFLIFHFHFSHPIPPPVSHLQYPTSHFSHLIPPPTSHLPPLASHIQFLTSHLSHPTSHLMDTSDFSVMIVKNKDKSKRRIHYMEDKRYWL